MSFTRSGYGAQRKNYMAQLTIERLTGEQQEIYTNAAMEWGTETEPVARLQYSLVTGNEVEETGLWMHDEIECGASPDGFVNHDGLVEIKCPNTATHIETLSLGKLPTQYRAQVQGQLWITERQWCDFVSFDPRMPENAQMIIIRVERDDQYIEQLKHEIEKFLEEVESQVAFIQDYGKDG